MFLLNECGQCSELDQETWLTPRWFKIGFLSVTGQSSVRLQANGVLLDPRRSMMFSPELDCMETWRLNQVASAQVENGVDCMSEEDNGRVGEATGEEDGERGGGPVVRAGGLGRSWRRWGWRGQRVGGGRVGRGVGRGTIQ